MSTTNAWSRLLVIAGHIGMVIGAIDPLEGSLLILPGSGLVAFGTYLSQSERRFTAFRVWVFILIAMGVGAMWGLSSVGGIGGGSGNSMWWGVLILPYPIGWSMGIWGPGSPRWLLWLGIGVSLWYLALPAMVLTRPGKLPGGAAIVVATFGVLTIVGCIIRLRRWITA